MNSLPCAPWGTSEYLALAKWPQNLRRGPSGLLCVNHLCLRSEGLKINIFRSIHLDSGTIWSQGRYPLPLMFWFHHGLPFAGIGLSNFHIPLPHRWLGIKFSPNSSFANRICWGSSLPPLQWLFQNPTKTSWYISFSHYCFRTSLTFVSLFGCRDSIPTKTAQLLFAQFQGREVEKIATESSHEYQTVSVHPAGGDSLCDGFQMYLGGFPFDSLITNLIHPIVLGFFSQRGKHKTWG